MLEPTASGRSASRKRQLPIAHHLASRCSIDTMLPTREKASQNPVTTRSALIGAEALVRLLNSARVREEFRLAELVSAASTNEINARLARLSARAQMQNCFASLCPPMPSAFCRPIPRSCRRSPVSQTASVEALLQLSAVCRFISTASRHQKDPISAAQGRSKCNGMIQGQCKAMLQVASESPLRFDAVAREWHTKYAPTWAASHSSKIIRRLEMDPFPWIGAKPVASIHPTDLLTLLRRVEERGAIETTHLLTPSVTYPEAVEIALCWAGSTARRRASTTSTFSSASRHGARAAWGRRSTSTRSRRSSRRAACRRRAMRRSRPPRPTDVGRRPTTERAHPRCPRTCWRRWKPSQRPRPSLQRSTRPIAYAIQWLIQTAVKAATRAKRIAQLVEMLARGETIHISRPLGAAH
jgi:Bacteriocin-protection, YdeI or OmpD-Associated